MSNRYFIKFSNKEVFKKVLNMFHGADDILMDEMCLSFNDKNERTEFAMYMQVNDENRFIFIG